MRLGLRMGLNSRQGGGGDLPSLDLAFALDKTRTARKGPTPAFTRVQATSTGSTYIGADKLINYAAANEPRFDHDPVTGLCKGLLIEESRTNLATWSQEFEKSAGWDQTTFAIVTANQIASPSGAIDADLITAKNSSYGGLLRKIGPPAYAASTTYTMSVYAKAGTHQFLGMRLSSDSANVGGNSYSVFTLSGAGSATAVTPTAGTINSVSCVNVGNGWYRCVLSYTTASTAPASTTDIAICQSNGNTGYIPSGTETVYLWGAQVEAGAFPLSYIPTTSGSAIRGADVCSIISTDFSSFYNQLEGTLFAECEIPSANQRAGIAVIGAISFNDNIALFKSDSTGGTLGDRFVPYVTQAGTLVASYDFGAGTGNGLMKVAASVALNNMIFARNGTISPADLTAAMPTPNRLTIGARADGNYINGHIARITYFRKRLSNAKLQTLTTL